jgi:hypothetical protein
MRGSVLVVAGVLALGCARGEPAVDTAARDSALVRAKLAADDLGRDLMGLLLGALEREGPAGAIAFCADSAQVRTARHAAQGVAVRRVGTRLRNPANAAADSAEAAILARLAEAHAAGAAPAEVVEELDGPGGREVLYARPILVAERCTACHGDPAGFDPVVRQVLADRYPQDAATGYAPGDLRGMLVARVGY